ncbi:MAG TPA: cytochrome c biogenesis protein CcsA [Chitinophagaceae bacterium]|nr:cytochrome c biogenesis protein CcsA [Chitinophagaceae bacterium]
MDYIGEQLWAGQLGKLFVLLSLISSVLATIAYFKSANAKNLQDAASWKQFARVAFGIDVASVLAIFGILFYIIAAHRFEYLYAWSHSEKSLSLKYLLSCIWEGQEGSFLLWTLWHGVLGMVLMRTAKQWEAPVMTVISFMQACLATMIMGMYFFGFKVGSNPFLLVREVYQEMPAFQRADYLLNVPQLQDGQGLNQLLQNYWMVIHPPILFLGFASTLVPFAFAIAGLWKKDYGGWTKTALPWTLFSAAILGTGIMLGAIWAYESLTFGGYWAWDPVENASLVPWLILIAGLHTQVIYNSTGRSLRATHLFFILAFILILYSTFLTRSGVLGDTSVHAFTDLGMNAQLMLFMGVFTIPSLVMFAVHYKRIPNPDKEQGEESTYSREFWMFIGSLVLFLSGAFIIISTSLPVFNKLLGTSWAMGEDVEFGYNRIQIFVAIILGLLTAVSQYLKYKHTARGYFLKKMALPTIIAIAISAAISWFGEIHYDKYGLGFLAAIHLALFAGVYTVVANAAYIWAGLRGKLSAAGASVAHVGFGLMLVGILISSSKKEVLSLNTTVALPFDPKSKENPLENQTLFKGMRTDMGRYWTTFINSDSTSEDGKISYFNILFERKDGKEKFNLYPNLIKNSKGQQGFSNNPDAKHYWNRDIFSYISYARDMDKTQDTGEYKAYLVNVNDTIEYSGGYITLDRVVPNPDNDLYNFTPNDTALMAELSVIARDSMRYKARPVFYIKNNQLLHIPDTVVAQNLAIMLSRVEDNKLEIKVRESSNMIPFVALKVYEFPFIRLVWLGTILMMVGFVMSIVRRIRLA